MKKSWVTAKELALLLRVSEKTVRRAYRNGEIPIARFRNLIRIDLDAVRQVMQQKHIRPSLREIPQRKGARLPAIAGGAHKQTAPVR